MPPVFAVFLIVAASTTLTASAPCSTSTTIDSWLQCRIVELQKQKVRQSGTEKQADQPSLASASTSLLDRTSASDLVGMGFSFFGAGSDITPSSGSAPTVTASAYALVTAARGLNPLDPAVYHAGKNWRRFSFTLGHEDASEKEGLDEARVFGAKILLLDRRDVSSAHAQKLLNTVTATSLNNTNVRYNAFSTRVRAFLYDKLGNRIDSTQYPVGGTAIQRAAFSNAELAMGTRLQQTLALLTEDESDEIDKFAANEGVVKAFYEEEETVQDVISRIRTAAQFAFTYTGKVRERTDTNGQFNEHRFQATFDYGLTGHTNVTVNASYEYRDSLVIGGDKRGGRVAGELLFEVNHDQALKKGIDPVTFSMAGEGKFLTSTDNIGRVQAKLVVPISNGISLPISVTWASSTELISESDVRGQFGFTFDLAKLLQAAALK
jgi:hypothetical protein